MISIKLRIYAYALNISSERRDTLIDFTDQLATMFSENRDQEQIAQFVMAQASNADEAKFICHAFDSALDSRFKSPYRARAVIYTWLLLRCQEIATMRQRFATAYSRLSKTTSEILEVFSATESAHPEPILDARLLPAPRDVIRNAIKEHAQAYKEMRDIDPEAFASSGFDANVKRLTRLLVRLQQFRDIDPNDFSAVALANTRSKDGTWPAEALRVLEKYGP